MADQSFPICIFELDVPGSGIHDNRTDLPQIT